MKLLLVDDHPLFREGISHALARLDQSLHLLFAASAAEAERIIGQQRDIALFLLDYHLPDSDGISLLNTLLRKNPAATAIMLSGEQDAVLIRAAINAGAKGFITKSSSVEVILSAIRLVLAGGIYLPPDVLNSPSSPRTGAASMPPSEKSAVLTARQLQVLACMLRGLSNKEIARDLAMSPSTVKVHVAAILKELEAKNRTQAVSRARALGWVD